MTLDKVSKNAFVEPKSALQNIIKIKSIKIKLNPNKICIFAVRGFIDSLMHSFAMRKIRYDALRRLKFYAILRLTVRSAFIAVPAVGRNGE